MGKKISEVYNDENLQFPDSELKINAGLMQEEWEEHLIHFSVYCTNLRFCHPLYTAST